MANPTTEAIYQFICAYIKQHGYGPTQREIAHGCYITQSNVFNQLVRLEAEGRIQREYGKARTIQLPNESLKT